MQNDNSDFSTYSSEMQEIIKVQQAELNELKQNIVDDALERFLFFKREFDRIESLPDNMRSVQIREIKEILLDDILGLRCAMLPKEYERAMVTEYKKFLLD